MASDHGRVLEGLRAELSSLEVAKARFPLWTDWGLDDESLAMHSVGLSYLASVGQELGHVAVADFPVSGHQIRADGVWWERVTRAPLAFFEFERHKDGSELRAKVRNLMKAWHVADTKPEILVLVFWTKRFYPTEAEALSALWRDAERGFVDGDRREFGPVPHPSLHVFECLHTQTRDGRLVLKRFKEHART